MPVHVVTNNGPDPLPAAACGADLCLRWEGPGRNALRNLAPLTALLAAEPPPLAADLLDIATAVYLADIGVLRGRNEDWVRNLDLTIAVREPSFWREHAGDLSHLLYVLTRDGISFNFQLASGSGTAHAATAIAQPFSADCVSLLSGGLDSLAGAVMLLRTVRRPLLVAHQSGNPTVRAAQNDVLAMLERLGGGQFAFAGTQVTAGGRSASALPFPAPGAREPSQRSRSLLYLALAVFAASTQGLREVYCFENGLLTVALPLSSARVGGLSTRSTHPRVIALANRLCQAADLGCEILNPFTYQTKAELIRDILRPALGPLEIQKTVSCWAAGRRSRQCGGCVACLVRRFAMLAAGLPDEAYEVDVLRHPARYVGTEAYTNLVDLLGQCAEFLRRDDLELLALWPELLDLQAAAVSLTDVLAMYRRYAAEVQGVVEAHFPEAAALLHSADR